MIHWLKTQGYKIVLILNAKTIDQKTREILNEMLDGVHILGEIKIPEAENSAKNKSGLFFDLLDTSINFVRRFRHKFLSEEELKFRFESDAVKKFLCPTVLIKATEKLCNEYKPVAVIAEYIFTSPCLDMVPAGTVRIIDTHDMFSRKKEQVIKYGVKDLLYCTPMEERSYLLKTDYIIAIQSVEADLFKKLVPERTVVTIGIDFDVKSTPSDNSKDGKIILVVGSSNPLNVHGLNEFIMHSWPLIRNKQPDSVLRVVGKLSEQIESNDENRIERCGWIENLDEEYKKATVVINPIRAGTGLKIKSVEALCRGKSLITTPNGAEGLAGNFIDDPFIVCDTWEEFADKVVLLLEFPETRALLEHRAVRYAKERFKSDIVYRPLAKILPKDV